MSVPVLKLKPGQQELVAKVIERMKAGDDSAFIAPWKNGGYGLSPRNCITGRPYRGWNRWATCLSAFFKDFRTPLWLTEKQIAEHGGSFIGGPAPTPIIFCGRYKRKANAGLSDRSEALPLGAAAAVERPRTLPEPIQQAAGAEAAKGTAAVPGETYGRFVREFRVYNLEQTVGVKLPKKMEQLLDERAARADTWKVDDGLAELRRIITGANVAPLYFDTYGAACYYNQGSHQIHVPQSRFFRSELDQWEAVGHETIHATGHKSLLNRPTLVGLHSRDSDEYCLEEITAVMGSLFLCQEAGVPVTEEREKLWTSYLKGFKALEILEKNPSIFVQALVHADFATQFILHPEARPDFIRNKVPPSQFEFEFREFATPRSEQAEPNETTIDGAAVEAEMERANTAAAALARAAGPEAGIVTPVLLP